MFGTETNLPVRDTTTTSPHSRNRRRPIDSYVILLHENGDKFSRKEGKIFFNSIFCEKSAMFRLNEGKRKENVNKVLSNRSTKWAPYFVC